MASPSTSQAVTKRSAETALMGPPLPASKRTKRPAIVLSDDDYVDRLSDIIKRQYFPGLIQNEALLEYMDAVKSHDQTWIADAGQKLDATMRKVDVTMPLGVFQAKYTSEDNEAVYQILDKANEARFEKRAWMYQGNRMPSKQRLAQQKVIQAREEAKKLANDPLNSQAPTTQDIALRPSQDLDQRPAGPTAHRHTAYNALMFAPDSVEEWTKTRAQIAEEESNAPPKTILYHNTRLPHTTTSTTTSADPPSPSHTAVADAIAGRPRPTQSEAGDETPLFKGYPLIHESPKPKPTPSTSSAPSSAPKSAQNPETLISTYGARLASGSHNPFTITDSQRREKLHHKMVDKIADGKKDGRRLGAGLGIFKGETSRFSYTPAPTPGMKGMKGKGTGMVGTVGRRRDASALTPAGKSLLERVRTPGRGGVGDGGLFGRERGEGAWTPGVGGRRRGR